ncbi:MAG: phenylacetate--CoA ligase family protein, partial [Aquificota bacterium]
MLQPDLEGMTRGELELLQLERLRRTIQRIAENNPRYHKYIGKVHPQDIKSLEDLKHLPFLTKDQLREGYPYGFTCAPRERFLRFHMSSGTTGTPIINFYTRNDINQWAEVMARCYSAAGVTHRDVIQITPSFGLFNGGFGFHYGAEKLGAMIIPIGAGRSMLQLQLMKELEATVLCAIASYPLRL